MIKSIRRRAMLWRTRFLLIFDIAEDQLDELERRGKEIERLHRENNELRREIRILRGSYGHRGVN